MSSRTAFVLLLWALLFVAQRTKSQSDTILLQQLFDPSCETPCYLGYEVGVTTLDQILAELDQNDIVYSYDSGLLQWNPPYREGVLAEGESGVIAISISNETVLQVMSPIYVDVSAVISVFGSPILITEDIDLIALSYPDLGLAFFVNQRGDSSKTRYIISSLPENVESMSSNPPGNPFLEACTLFGTPPCLVPTATPTLTDTPSSTPTFTPTFTPSPAPTPFGGGGAIVFECGDICLADGYNTFVTYGIQPRIGPGNRIVPPDYRL